jgi:hypothetical protein
MSMAPGCSRCATINNAGWERGGWKPDEVVLMAVIRTAWPTPCVVNYSMSYRYEPLCVLELPAGRTINGSMGGDITTANIAFAVDVLDRTMSCSPFCGTRLCIVFCCLEAARWLTFDPWALRSGRRLRVIGRSNSRVGIQEGGGGLGLCKLRQLPLQKVILMLHRQRGKCLVID